MKHFYVVDAAWFSAHRPLLAELDRTLLALELSAADRLTTAVQQALGDTPCHTIGDDAFDVLMDQASRDGITGEMAGTHLDGTGTRRVGEWLRRQADDEARAVSASIAAAQEVFAAQDVCLVILDV